MPGVSDVMEDIIGDKLFESPDALVAMSQFEYIMNTDYRYLMLGFVGRKDFLKEAETLRESISEAVITKFDSSISNNYYQNKMLEYIDHIIYMNENDNIYGKSMYKDLRSIKDSIDKDEARRINKILLNK